MKYITEKQYNNELKQIKIQNTVLQRKMSLKAEKNKYKKKIKLPSTSKLMAVYLFVILNVVLIYAMVAMWHFMDFTYLGVLITDVAAQVLTYCIYAAKSVKENTVNGITFETAMLEAKSRLLNKQEENIDVSSVG